MDTPTGTVIPDLRVIQFRICGNPLQFLNAVQTAEPTQKFLINGMIANKFFCTLVQYSIVRFVNIGNIQKDMLLLPGILCLLR